MTKTRHCQWECPALYDADLECVEEHEVHADCEARADRIYEESWRLKRAQDALFEAIHE